MRVVVQRCGPASVSVDGIATGRIDSGLVILVGATHGDTEKDAEFLADKCAHLRIFEDADGKMNLSGIDVGASALVVSQFTLYADASKGRRPSFTGAAPPDVAERLYEHFMKALESHGYDVQSGRFGAKMEVSLVNRGPVTLIIDSKREVS